MADLTLVEKCVGYISGTFANKHKIYIKLEYFIYVIEQISMGICFNLAIWIEIHSNYTTFNSFYLLLKALLVFTFNRFSHMYSPCKFEYKQITFSPSGMTDARELAILKAY